MSFKVATEIIETVIC